MGFIRLLSKAAYASTLTYKLLFTTIMIAQLVKSTRKK